MRSVFLSARSFLFLLLRHAVKLPDKNSSVNSQFRFVAVWGAFRSRLTTGVVAKNCIDYADQKRIRICMRTTLNIDDAIFEKASKLTGIQEKTLLLHEGLKALIEKESSRRLAKLGGSSPKTESIRRR